MAKISKSEIENEVETKNTSASTGTELTGVQSETPAPKKEKVVRKVEMENGTTVDFGSRANLLTALDLEENTVTFLHSNGKVVVFKQEDIAATEDEAAFEFSKAPELVRKGFLYGVMERVKSSTGPIKAIEDIYTEVVKQVAAIKGGTFYIRSLAGDDEEVGLTELQHAYALAKAQLQPEQFAHWSNVEDETTIKEVSDLWETYTLKDKAKIRANAVVMLHLANLKQAKAGKETADLI
jgi:hypothetical protein